RDIPYQSGCDLCPGDSVCRVNPFLVGRDRALVRRGRVVGCVAVYLFYGGGGEGGGNIAPSRGLRGLGAGGGCPPRPFHPRYRYSAPLFLWPAPVFFFFFSLFFWRRWLPC